MVEKAFSRLASWSTRYPWVVMVVAAVLTAFFALGIPRIHQEYGLKTMLPRSSAPVRTMEMAEELGWGTQEEQVLVTAEDVLDGRLLRSVAEYRRVLQERPGIWGDFITNVETPLDRMVLMRDGQVVSASPPVSLLSSYSNLSDEELSEQVRMNIEHWEKRSEETGLPLEVRNLSEERDAVLINARLNTSLDTAAQMERERDFSLLTAEHFRKAGGEVGIAGLVSVNRESSRRTLEDTRVLFAVALAFILLILYLTFRKTSDVLLILTVIGLSIAWVMGMQGWLGFPFTYTGAAIMPLLLGINIAYAIHVLSRYREERAKGNEPVSSAFNSVVTVGVAVFMTAVTTAFGFASFGISNMPPIQQFGVLCVAGVLFSFLLSATLLPSLLILRDRRFMRVSGEAEGDIPTSGDGEEVGGGWLDRFMAKVSVVTEHHRRWAALLCLVLLGGSLFLAAGLRTEADIFKALPQDMPSLRTTRAINDIFGGQDLAFTLAEGDLLEPENLRALLEYEDALAESGVRSEGGQEVFERRKISSIADLVWLANGKTIPEERGAVLPSLLNLQEELGYPEMDPSSLPVTLDMRAGIIEVRLDRGTQNDMRAIARTMRETAAEVASRREGLSLNSSGTPVLLDEILGNILPTQLKTTSLALLLCALTVMLVFGSLFYGAAATSVVFISVALELGILSLIGWPLDFMTVMVSSLVIGAGIDFGIHVTHRFVEERDSGAVGADDSIRRTVESVGKALLSAAVTTAGAFAIIALSGVSYMRRFGVITAISLCCAMLSALLALPCLLAWKAEREDRGSATGRCAQE